MRNNKTLEETIDEMGLEKFLLEVGRICKEKGAAIRRGFKDQDGIVAAKFEAYGEKVAALAQTINKKYVVINTMGNNDLETFRIHGARCSQVKEEVRLTHGHSWEVEAESPEAVVEAEMVALEYDSNPYPRDEFKILKCAVRA